MKWTVEDIRNYMKEKNIDNNLNTNEPIPILGISKIQKIDGYQWIIYMDGPENSIYRNGYFKLTFSSLNDFPNKKPEIRILNKIYHLQVNPLNGHVCTGFLNDWNPTTTISECLVGIYLFLDLEQNPFAPYSGEMAREYENNRQEFNRKAEEWTLKYASLSVNDFNRKAEEWTLKYASLSVNDLKRIYEKRFAELENKNKILEENITNIKNELNQMKSIISEKDSTIDSYKEKYIKLLEEIKDLKLKNQ